MTQPNELIETIEKALGKIATQGWGKAPSKMQCFTWLRALLDENKRLQSGWDKHLASSAKDYLEISRLQEQLQRTREELEQEKEAHEMTNGFYDSLIIRSKEIEDSLNEELEQVKTERDELRAFWKELTIDQAKEYIKSVESLRNELSAKSSLLRMFVSEEDEKRILSQYKENPRP